MFKDKLNPRLIADLQVLHELIIPRLQEVDRKGDGAEFERIGKRYGVLVRDLYITLDSRENPICLPPNLSINRFRDDISRSGTEEFGYQPEEIEFWSQGDAIFFFHKFLDEKGVFQNACS